MAAHRYASMLRGVNVGDRQMKMAELRGLFESLGLHDVASYLQSGNVVFSAADAPAPLEQRIAEAIGSAFGHGDVDVLLRTPDELAAIVDANPFLAEGADPKALHVTFLAADPASIDDVPTDDPSWGADAWAPGDRAVYVHCPGGYGRTKLTNAFFERKLGVRATTRNWRTVLALLDLARG